MHSFGKKYLGLLCVKLQSILIVRIFFVDLMGIGRNKSQ